MRPFVSDRYHRIKIQNFNLSSLQPCMSWYDTHRSPRREDWPTKAPRWRRGTFWEEDASWASLHLGNARLWCYFCQAFCIPRVHVRRWIKNKRRVYAVAWWYLEGELQLQLLIERTAATSISRIRKRVSLQIVLKKAMQFWLASSTNVDRNQQMQKNKRQGRGNHVPHEDCWMPRWKLTGFGCETISPVSTMINSPFSEGSCKLPDSNWPSASLYGPWLQIWRTRVCKIDRQEVA